MNIETLKQYSKEIRLNVLRLTHEAGNKGAHIAPSLSMVEIMAVLFGSVMNHKNDTFILSKGHGGLCYYCALYQVGLITKEQLDSFEMNGGEFPGQPSRLNNKMIQFSSGSLGLGLSYATGIGWHYKNICKNNKVFVLLGDGELNEGSNWEAVMFAKQQKLNNITAVVDLNRMQSDGFSKDILDIDIINMWKSCGWKVIECDGHDEEKLFNAFNVDSLSPKVILADTVKGKGVSFMENNRIWHHNHITNVQYEAAIKEVEAKQ